MEAVQRRLAEGQVEEFRHDQFVQAQLSHFRDLTREIDLSGVVVDVGGGCGHFANALRLPARVIDVDKASLDYCESHYSPRVQAVMGDALNPPARGDEGVACFNLILHHLVADTERKTRDLQGRALLAWKGKVEYVFVNEYVYDSLAGDIGGRLIYAITSSKLLSAIAGFVAKAVPSLRANTFGVGVRFRSDASWRRVFSDCGLDLVGYAKGKEELTFTRRVLFLRSIRRDSYLLRVAA